jgi:hypothetical protein
VTNQPELPREDRPALPRYDEPLGEQEPTTVPRYRLVEGPLGASGVASCSVCGLLTAGAEGEAQHTEFHRLLAGALLALSGSPAYGVRRL